MELNQRPEQADDSTDHRWAGFLGTAIAMVTLTLPIVMISYYSPVSSNAQPAPEVIYILPEELNQSMR